MKFDANAAMELAKETTEGQINLSAGKTLNKFHTNLEGVITQHADKNPELVIAFLNALDSSIVPTFEALAGGQPAPIASALGGAPAPTAPASPVPTPASPTNQELLDLRKKVGALQDFASELAGHAGVTMPTDGTIPTDLAKRVKDAIKDREDKAKAKADEELAAAKKTPPAPADSVLKSDLVKVLTPIKEVLDDNSTHHKGKAVNAGKWIFEGDAFSKLNAGVVKTYELAGIKPGE